MTGGWWFVVGALAELAASGAGWCAAKWHERRGEAAEPVDVPAGPAYVPLAERRAYLIGLVNQHDPDLVALDDRAWFDLSRATASARSKWPAVLLEVRVIAEYGVTGEVPGEGLPVSRAHGGGVAG